MSSVMEGDDGLFDANSTLLVDKGENGIDPESSMSQPTSYQCYDNGTLVVPVQVSCSFQDIRR